MARFLIVFALPAAWGLGEVLGGAWRLAPWLVGFVAVPALDGWWGDDVRSPAPDDAARLRDRVGPDALLFAWGLVQVGLTAWLWTRVGAMPAADAAGAVLGLGLLAGGGGITVAHEAMHRPQRAHRALAEGLMLLACYPHFCIEHVLGHHRHVGTPGDPATARRGETLYAFLVRSIRDSARSAWRLERDRVARLGLAPGGPQDRRARYAVELALLVVAAFAVGGLAAVASLAGSGAVAVLFLESINYIEHYGLVRALDAEGRPVRVAPQHSWNSARAASNAMLFQLQRHADHHATASRPYPLLRHHAAAPQLPAGYPLMVMLATVPRWWFRVMDPRVDAAMGR